MAWLSIASMYAFDNTLFDGMTVPIGVDKNALVFNLLSETAELEVLYPDISFMKEMVKMWSTKEFHIWERMYKTTTLEYNPIENYDRIEEWTDKQIEESRDDNTGNVVSRVAAFNESELIPSGSGDTVTRGQHSGQSNGQHSGRTHGNIGVTTSQQMIEAERRVSEFNIIDYITSSFKRRFCIMVY